MTNFGVIQNSKKKKKQTKHQACIGKISIYPQTYTRCAVYSCFLLMKAEHCFQSNDNSKQNVESF